MRFWGILLILVVLSGCLDFFESDDESIAEEDAFLEEYLAEEKAKMEAENAKAELITTTSVKKTTTTASTTTTLFVCLTECCVDLDCNGFYTCNNGTCGEKPCPFECCIMGMYPDKICPIGSECINYTCTKLQCPFECCNQTLYIGGECANGYECKMNKCFTRDSDGDGLSDLYEQEIGTDIYKKDTDGDGLSDKDEVKIWGSDPLNPNTDGDRYKDGEDPNPVIAQTAVLNINVASKIEINNSLLNELLYIAKYNISKVTDDTVFLNYESWVQVANTGDDYTAKHNYTLTLWRICGEGINPAYMPHVRAYIANGTNLTDVNGTNWYTTRNYFNSSNTTIAHLKDHKIFRNNTLQNKSKYKTRITGNLTIAEIKITDIPAITSTRRCWYNQTITQIEYERW